MAGQIERDATSQSDGASWRDHLIESPGRIKDILENTRRIAVLGPMKELAGLFPRGELAVQEGAGHFPFFDDPETFRTLVAGWLAR